jgi:hypothetical protein
MSEEPEAGSAESQARSEVPGEAPPGEGPPGGAPTNEEELRRRLEQELRKLRVQDVLLQSVVNLINLTSRRIGKEDEQDLGQARLGIEAVRALVDLLDPDTAKQVRNALAELQVAYAREAEGGAPAASPDREAREAAAPEPEEDRRAAERGERRPPPGLWTPPGST